MNGEAIFWPMLVQVLLTFFIYALVSFRRISAINSGQAKPADYKIPTIEPDASATAARNLINQFELPVLFYAACLVLFVLGAVGQAAVLVAWAFTFVRIVHAYIHVTTNRLRFRRPLFITSFVFVFVLWALIAARLIAA